MAEDVITLLNFVGWTEKHQVHVVGVSLGGMIAQGVLFRPARNAFILTALCVSAHRGRGQDSRAYRIPEFDRNEGWAASLGGPTLSEFR